MSIIIRLQNLPWEANSLDIRRYFQGLSIPDGGVHIVGGDKGDAFIAFSSDEDARQAMGRDGGMVKDSRIKLFLSSRSEMQNVIEQARTQTMGIKGSDSSMTPLSAPPRPGSEMSGMHHQAINSSVSAVPSSLAPSVHAGGFGKSDFLRRSDDRDMAHNMNDRGVIDSLGRSANSGGHSGAHNRSRSRSPFGRDNPSAYSRHHPDDPRAKMDSDLLAGGPMPGIHSIPPSGYGPNSMPPLRSGPLDGPIASGGGGGPLSNPLMSSRSGYPEASKDTGLLGLGSSMHHNPWSRGVGGGEDGYNNYGPPNDQMKNDRLVANDKHSAYSNLHGNPILNHVPPNFSVELRGLSFNIVPRDVQEFFRPSGLYLPEDAIKIIVNDRGYPTGCAIVHLNSEREFDAAMTRNGCFMGDRRIDVMPLPESLPPPNHEAEELMRSGHLGGGMNSRNDMSSQGIPAQCDFVVYMKGIPYNSCTNPDVADFFHGLDCVDILFEVDPKTGKPAGNAYVEFATKEDFNAALEMNMKHMGKRYIEIFPTTRDDMNEARRIAMGGDPDRSIPRNDLGPRQNFCISVTNLPQTVTNRDLTNYFTDLGAQPFAIHIMLKPNGFNAGEAFVEFVSRDQQSKALRRDRTFMGSHQISVKAVAYDMMRRIVGLPPQGPPSMDNMRSYPGGGHSEINDPRMREGKMMRGRGRGDDFRRRGGGGGGGGVAGAGATREDKIMSDPSRQPSFNDPRCVIIAQNIPYRATNEDICVFFSDFNISPDCIVRRVNDKGQVAADCKIAFRSPEDATRAVKMMHKKYLIGRPVFLRLESSTI